jgi:hypothetical protein
VGKPVLIAVKNTANKPESVAKNNSTAEAQPTTMPDATVGSAPDSGAKASSDMPIPPEKSAA